MVFRIAIYFCAAFIFDVLAVTFRETALLSFDYQSDRLAHKMPISGIDIRFPILAALSTQT